MSALIASALLVASSISSFKRSMCAEYPSSAVQISSLKSSMTTKSGKKGRMSSILRRSVLSRKRIALGGAEGRVSVRLARQHGEGRKRTP